MKKIKLTESELVSLIEKVVNETQVNEGGMLHEEQGCRPHMGGANESCCDGNTRCISCTGKGVGYDSVSKGCTESKVAKKNGIKGSPKKSARAAAKPSRGRSKVGESMRESYEEGYRAAIRESRRNRR